MTSVGKKTRSFTVDEELDELLRERDDINASSVVNSFLREYLAAGRGNEAALETRLKELDDKIGRTRTKLDRLERDRDRVESLLADARADINGEANDIIQLVRNGRVDRDAISADSPVITQRAGKIGIPAERLLEEVETRL